jgi:hypothetical protein
LDTKGAVALGVRGALRAFVADRTALLNKLCTDHLIWLQSLERFGRDASLAATWIDGEGQETKVVKNRLHRDLLPADGDWDAEVARLEALGAERVQFFNHDPTQTWRVMRDPEGNEFCLVWLHDEARS